MRLRWTRAFALIVIVECVLLRGSSARAASAIDFTPVTNARQGDSLAW